MWNDREMMLLYFSLILKPDVLILDGYRLK